MDQLLRPERTAHMTYGWIDHGKHGWALLALRFPAIRTLPIPKQVVAEMAECYSIATLYVDKLTRENAGATAVQEYDELRCSIEKEVEWYMAKLSKRAG